MDDLNSSEDATWLSRRQSGNNEKNDKETYLTIFRDVLEKKRGWSVDERSLVGLLLRRVRRRMLGSVFRFVRG